jgi:hypothetical protein
MLWLASLTHENIKNFNIAVESGTQQVISLNLRGFSDCSCQLLDISRLLELPALPPYAGVHMTSGPRAFRARDNAGAKMLML